MNYNLIDPKPGIGGAFAISDDTFKITLEEAIKYVKSNRRSVDEKIWTLQAIATKRDCEIAFAQQKGQNDRKVIKFEEIKA